MFDNDLFFVSFVEGLGEVLARFCLLAVWEFQAQLNEGGE